MKPQRSCTSSSVESRASSFNRTAVFASFCIRGLLPGDATIGRIFLLYGNAPVSVRAAKSRTSLLIFGCFARNAVITVNFCGAPHRARYNWISRAIFFTRYSLLGIRGYNRVLAASIEVCDYLLFLYLSFPSRGYAFVMRNCTPPSVQLADAPGYRVASAGQPRYVTFEYRSVLDAPTSDLRLATGRFFSIQFQVSTFIRRVGCNEPVSFTYSKSLVGKQKKPELTSGKTFSARKQVLIFKSVQRKLSRSYSLEPFPDSGDFPQSVHDARSAMKSFAGTDWSSSRDLLLARSSPAQESNRSRAP